MEQFNIFSLLSRRWMLILPIVAVVTLATVAVNSRRPESVIASIAVTASPVRDTSTTIVDPRSESLLVAKTLISWFADPAFAHDVFLRSGVVASDDSLRGLSRSFEVVTDSGDSAAFQVHYAALNNADATQIAGALTAVLSERIDQYNASQGNGLQFKALVGSPFIASTASRTPLVPVAGAMVGIIFALVVAALLDRRTA